VIFAAIATVKDGIAIPPFLLASISRLKQGHLSLVTRPVKRASSPSPRVKQYAANMRLKFDAATDHAINVTFSQSILRLAFTLGVSDPQPFE
jgi:hypothetical protein